MEFRELSDDQWKFIKPHLPPQPITGRKKFDVTKSIITRYRISGKRI